MKKLVILLVLGLVFNLNQASEIKTTKNNVSVFDEDFGYTDKILESRKYKGRQLKEVKQEILNKTIEKFHNKKEKCYDGEGDSVGFYYSYRVNPDDENSKYYQRYQSIKISKSLLKIYSKRTREEMYYIVTGERLLANNPLDKLNDEEFCKWYKNEKDFKHCRFIVQASYFFQLFWQSESYFDISKLNWIDDIEQFEKFNDFEHWKQKYFSQYKDIFGSEFLFKCYYIFLYNDHAIRKAMISNFEDDVLEKQLDTILCPYPVGSGKGFQVNSVYQKLFGISKSN